MAKVGQTLENRVCQAVNISPNTSGYLKGKLLYILRHCIVIDTLNIRLWDLWLFGTAVDLC